MKHNSLVAALDVVLIVPGALFLTAVLVGLGDPPQYELAHVAQRIAGWYSAQRWTLPVLLMGMPFAAFVMGCATLLQPQSMAVIRQHVTTILVAATTLAAAGIMAIVVLHMAAN